MSLFFKKNLKTLWVKAYLKYQKFYGTTCFIHINKCGGTTIEKALRIPKIHDTVMDRIDLIGHHRWEAMHTFSIVRNPFSRVCSHYKYRLKTAQLKLSDCPTVDEWVYRAYVEEDERLVDRALFFMPCAEWLQNASGEIGVREVFRLEDIANWWPQLASRLSVTKNIKVMNRNHGFDENEAKTLLSNDSKEIILNKFRVDFEMWYREDKSQSL